MEKLLSPETHTDMFGQPLIDRELALMNAYWRTCNYPSVGMIYLKDNPLLRTPLTADYVKHRLLATAARPRRYRASGFT